MLPRLALVGRPNVGKSSLMNMIASRRVSIVDPTPGVTRDRVMAICELPGPDASKPPVKVELIDTGGYGVYTAEGRRVDDAGHDLAALTDDIEQQIAKAVASADIILFVIDSQAGLTAQDLQIAKLLREGGIARGSEGDRPSGTGRPLRAESDETDALRADGSPAAGAKVMVVANKVDGPRWEAHAYEAAGLGFGEPLLVAAKNSYNRRHLVESLSEAAAPIAERLARAAKAQQRPDDLRLAIVGKRNAGKSSLVNFLAGEQRVIVSEIPGTTRDAIDVRFELDGRTLVAIDTAGLRKKKSFADRIEWYALERMREAIGRCDVALHMIDATVPVSQVDQHVAQDLAKHHTPTIIVVNKWDLAKGRPLAGRPGSRTRAVTPGDYERYLREELKGLWYAPIAIISAKTGQNIRDTIDLAFELKAQALERVGTGKLNRLVREIMSRRGPASGSGAFTKVLYVAQVAVAPPTIVCVVNHPQLFTSNYRRFLLNRFKEELPFSEVPVKLIVRGRREQEEYLASGNAALDARLAEEARLARGAPAEPASDEAIAELFEPELDAGTGVLRLGAGVPKAKAGRSARETREALAGFLDDNGDDAGNDDGSGGDGAGDDDAGDDEILDEGSMFREVSSVGFEDEDEPDGEADNDDADDTASTASTANKASKGASRGEEDEEDDERSHDGDDLLDPSLAGDAGTFFDEPRGASAPGKRPGANNQRPRAGKGSNTGAPKGPRKPSGKPFAKPSGKPTGKPTGKSTGKPFAKPSGKPTGKPTGKTTGKPFGKPSGKPTGKPSGKPFAKPTGDRSAPSPGSGPRSGPRSGPGAGNRPGNRPRRSR